VVTSGTALLVMAIFKWSYRDPSVRREPSKRTIASTGTRLLSFDYEELIGRGFGSPDLTLATRKLSHAGVAVG